MVFSGIPDFICHFHFLRDIGKDFIDTDYSSLRSCLRKHKVSSRLHALAREMKQYLSGKDSNIELLAKSICSGEPIGNVALLPLSSAYAIILWMLQGKKSGDGYGFPFDRTLLSFAERILEGLKYLQEPSIFYHDSQNKEKKMVVKLTKIVSDINNDTNFKFTIQELHWRCKVFDNLRKAMLIGLHRGKEGLNDEGTAKEISTIRTSVQKFRRKLDNNAKWLADGLCCKMAKQIDKWNDKLFADPIDVTTPNGTVTIYPQRTNNILEQFFRRFRRGQRRKTGNNSLRRTLQTMLSDTPLIRNLANDKYMKILLGEKDTLEDLFADLEVSGTKFSTELSDVVNLLLPGFSKLMGQ